MKNIFDIATIVLFFLVYKFFDIYAAVATTMVCYSLQVSVLFALGHKIEKLQWLTLTMVVGLGGLTFLFHDEIFFKWKPTAVYWLFTLGFIASHFFGNKQPALKRLLSDKVSLNEIAWHRLNNSWAAFFFLLGALNIAVAYTYSTTTWVNFKLFGCLLLTLIFVVIQAFYMSRHIIEDGNERSAS